MIQYSWEQRFAPHILERGYDYYLADRVKRFSRQDGSLVAIVSGSDDYHVCISFDGDEQIDDMECSCPYAEGGYNCKHMAAVLYRWDDPCADDTHDTIEADPEEDGYYDSEEVEDFCDDDEEYPARLTLKELSAREKTISELMKKADSDTIHAFLKRVLIDDDDLAIQFKSIIDPSLSKKEMQQYYRVVDRAIHRCAGRDGFIDYHESGDYMSAMHSILREHVRSLMDNGHLQAAFDLAAYIFVRAGQIDIDDSDGSITVVAELCCDYWKVITEYKDESVNDYIFRWCMNHLDGSVIDYLEEYIEGFLIDELNDEQFVQQKLAFFDKKAHAYADMDVSSWSRDYHAGRWAVAYLQLIHDNGSTITKERNYAKPFWFSSDVRSWFMMRYEKEKQTKKLIALLKESCKLDAGMPGLITKYRRKLKDLYKHEKMKSDYLDILHLLVTENEPGNVELFNELKKQYSKKDWPQIRENIYKSIPVHSIAPLYEAEEQYDLLMQHVNRSNGLYELQRYEKILAKDYHDELLVKYETELERMARPAAGRRMYQELVRHMRRMKRLPGGKERVREICRRWHELYRNRRAMMEELDRV